MPLKGHTYLLKIDWCSLISPTTIGPATILTGYMAEALEFV